MSERYCAACGKWHADMGIEARTKPPRRAAPYPDEAELAALRMLPEEDHFHVARLLAVEGYTNLKPLPGHRYAALRRFGFTTAIVVGKLDDLYGIGDRWCYHDAAMAADALAAWNGAGEPVGWHRHPGSGRRLAEDDEAWDGDNNQVPQGMVYLRG
ncbi:MAG TPA: hypothetical protein VGC15_06810 [Acetobacteraceae bacterium]